MWRDERVARTLLSAQSIAEINIRRNLMIEQTVKFKLPTELVMVFSITTKTAVRAPAFSYSPT